MKQIKIYEERYERLSHYEREAHDQGFRMVAGVDEAGRGPLAGPVVAAACILGEHKILGLDDSKKLSAKRREELYEEIINHAASCSIAVVGPGEIDEINILEATKRAMNRCVLTLEVQSDYVLSDAVKIPDISIPCLPLVKGDAVSNSIAAASILAKVYRDRLMCNYDLTYPGYGFSKHKGYGTKDHYVALRTKGPCEIHRQTFLKSFYAQKNTY
ncbi:MAG: ribonuclease HII [Clostridiales bacterium]|nr:ribonuclease HII [Clostridiales bacterium]